MCRAETTNLVTGGGRAVTVPLSSADPVRLGDYELLGRLGSGGQGVVYLARPVTVPGRTAPAVSGQVAIKLLHAQMLESPNARARFVRELSLLQRVAGFCTAQVIDADLAGDQPYIVSEYVPGPSLRRLVQEQGPRAGADLDRLAISSITALTAIHRAGIVHRDFKPQNVLMGADGPRVIDFGIARALDPSATVTSQIVGTPAYMAPEQFTGTGIGPAADLFAWAATMLFAATGRDPFAAGSVPATMYRIMHHEPDLSVLPEQIAAVAAEALRKDAASRPSAEEALMRLLGDRTTPNRPPPTRVVPPRRPSTGAGTPGGGGQDATAGAPTAREPGTPPTGRPDPGTVVAETEAAPRPQDAGQARPPVGVSPTWQPGAPPTGAAPSVPPTGAAPGGPQPAGWNVTPGQAGTGAGRAPRELKRGVAAVTGLVLAALLAALDVLSMAILVARPDLTSGPGGRWLLVVAASFVFLAVVTLVGVVLALRGGRAAAWTVLTARVVRVPLWALWTQIPDVDWSVASIAGYAAVTALMVALLAVGLRSR